MATPRYARPRYSTLRAYVAAQPRDLTQSAIALRLGLTPNRLSQYLGGHVRISRDVALRLARDHGIDLRGLLDGTP
jgi:plasmid maintenance system antidote protein VapI